MEYNKWFAARFAMVIAFVLLVSSAAFAQDRDDYRSDRISTQGRITSMERVGDQYRVTLNHGGYTYYVPVTDVRDRDLRMGDRVRIDGFVAGDMVNVNLIAFAGQPAYARRSLLSCGALRRDRLDERKHNRRESSPRLSLDAR